MQTDEIMQQMRAIYDAAQHFARSWSGSSLGYHSLVYYGDFDPKPSGAVFSSEWGLMDSIANPTRGDWRERSYEEIADAVFRRARNPDFDAMEKAARQSDEVFEDCKQELLATLDAVLAVKEDKQLRDLREAAAKLIGFMSVEQLARANLPPPGWSRDSLAVSGNVRIPAHVAIEARAMSIGWRVFALQELGKTVRQCRLYLQKRVNLN